jgi:hypothetical protein
LPRHLSDTIAPFLTSLLLANDLTNMSVKLTMLEGTMAHLHCSFDIYIFSKIKEVNAQEGALKK